MKKLICMLLALTTVCSALCITAWAQEQEPIFSVQDSGAVLVSYPNAPAIVTIPAEYEGKPVVAIGKEAFANNQTIGKVVIPASVRSIGAKAFYNCQYLQQVEFDYGYHLYVGESAFEGCVQLSQVNLYYSTFSLDNYAFKGCTNLKNIEASPNKQCLFGKDIFADTAFYNNPENWEGEGLYWNGVLVALKAVALSEFTPKEDTFAIACGVFGKEQQVEQVTLPDGVSLLNVGAFEECTTLKQVTLGKGITTIPNRCFMNCTALTTVTLQAKSVAVATEGFKGCTALTTVENQEMIKRIEDSAFAGCTALEQARLNAVEVLGKNAFEGCTALKEVTFEKLNDLLSYAFVGCVNLEKVTFGSSIWRIGNYAFYQCENLKEVVFAHRDKGINIGVSAFEGCGFTQVTLPAKSHNIDNRAFANCPNLEKVDAIFDQNSTIHKDIMVGTAFYNNPENWEDGGLYWNGELVALKPFTAKEFTVKEGTIGVASGVFGKDQKVSVVILPDSVADLNERAFWGCTTLKTLVVGQNMEEFSHDALYECPNFTTLYWPKEIEDPDVYIYYGMMYNVGSHYQVIGNGQGWMYKHVNGYGLETYLDESQMTLGDPNGDGQINAQDALIVLKTAVEKILPYGKQAQVLDVNTDGTTNAKDALEILKYAVSKGEGQSGALQ